MKLLVTGGSGLIGTYLQSKLDGIYISSKDYDLTKEADVNRMYQEYKPDTVIHLAARVGGIIDNIQKPFEYFEDNALMNTYMVKYAREHGVTRFIGTLSSCIYPDTSNTYPLLEGNLHDSLPNKNNFGYGYAKRLLGVHIDIAREQGYKYSYIIPSNLYGEFERGDLSTKHFVGALLQKIRTANETNQDYITLFGDGTPLRQFTYAKDVADVLSLLIEHDINENLNISNSENLTIDQMAKLALKATNSEHLSIVYDKTKPNGQYRKDICTKKFENIFPNYKFTSYIKGVEKVYNAIKNQHD